MATVDEIRGMYEKDNMTQQEIAERIGRSRSYVQKIVGKPRRAAGSESHSVVVRDEGRTRPFVARHMRNVSIAHMEVEGALSSEAMTGPLEQDSHSGWQTLGLDSTTWKKLGQALTLPTLASVSPGISRAIWDYLRLLDSGHEIHAYVPGSEGVIDERAELVLEEIIARIESSYSSMKAFFQQGYMGSLIRGAFCMQLLLDANQRTTLDILIPDPAVIRFQNEKDPIRGRRWVPGVMVKGEWVSVEGPTFVYVPVDPLPGNPYGRSVLAPATFPAIFMLGLLYDLRRVVAQQGYPRTDVTIDSAALRATYPETMEADDFQAVLDEVIQQVERDYAGLQPDDAFIHSDAIDVDRASGAIDSGVMTGAVGLLQILERMEVRSLKTMPMMMGLTDGVSEANANRQWEIFVAGIKSMQHHMENVTGRLLETALRLEGIIAKVKVEFAEIRSSEMLRDEQVNQIKLANAITAEQAGYMSKEEAAIYAVGHAPVDEGAEEDEEDEPDISADPVDDPEPEDAPVTTEDDPVDPETTDRVSDAFLARAFGRPLFRSGGVAVRASGKVEQSDIDRVVLQWRSHFRTGIERRLLDAQVRSVSDADETTEPWVWLEEERQFVHQESQTVLHTSQCREVLQRSMDKYARRFRKVLRERLESRSVRSLSDFEEEGWEIARDTMLTSYVLGRGGKGMVTDEDFDEAQAMVDEQFEYWSDYMDELDEADSIDIEAVEGRGLMYLGVGYLFYEHARASSWEIDLAITPPVHPRCACSIEYGRDGAGQYATWMLQSGNPCPECTQLAAENEIIRRNQ